MRPAYNCADCYDTGSFRDYRNGRNGRLTACPRGCPPQSTRY